MTRGSTSRDTVPPEKFVPRHARRCACAVWFVLGSLAGGLAVGLFWLKQTSTGEPLAEAPPPAARQPQPKFEFYNLLPEMEVVLSDAEVKEATSRPPPKAPAETPPKPKTEAGGTAPPTSQTSAAELATGDTYLVQLGSFTRKEDADRLKAQLAMQGVQTQIQQVTINGKDTYYRVRTGALRGSQALSEVRSRLKKGGNEGIVIKVKS